MKIECLENGFELTYGGDRYFIPFHAVEYVGPIKIENDGYDILSRSYVGSLLKKRMFFDIHLKNNKFFSVYYDEWKTFERKNEKLSFMQKIADYCYRSDHDGLSPEEYDWMNEDNMVEETKRLETLRREVINHLRGEE